MTPLPLRVIVTAQAFGFGPAAAMAQVFDHLRPRVRYLAFAGAGHTYDLHVNLPYEAIHRLPDVGTAEAFGRLCASHHAALVACDFPAAEAAKAAGIPVGVYDPIPWYWPEWPQVLRSADLYMCQDFFGVRERIRDTGHGNIVIVPPISPTLARPMSTRSRDTLLNLGGLRNPYLSREDCVSYARLMLALFPVAADLYDEVHVVTSHDIALELRDHAPAARTVSPQEAQRLLGRSEIAAMTPGLGNIYEAAALAARVLWLPPANDSQGQQLDALRQRGLAPFAADWHDLLPGRAPIEYGGREPEVIASIADAIRSASQEPAAILRLRTIFHRAHHAPATPNPLNTLLDRFGVGGDRLVAETFVQRLLAPLALSDGNLLRP
jgi:hypothetical protein